MRSWTRRAWSGYCRTVLVGAASCALLFATLGTATGQEDAPAPSSAFSNGTAKATAVVARVAPGIGALELGISAGVAVAEIKNTIGQAQAEALDLGLLGSTLTAEGCFGDPPVKQSDLPSALRVDSRGGDTSATEDEYPVDGATIGGGRKHVEASTRPAAEAVSTVAGVLGPLLTFDAGKATSSTEVLPGEARISHAQVNVNIDIGGVIKLSGLRWEATHRTGKDPDADATFDLGTAALLGMPIPLESLTELETLINSLLESSGVQVTFPKIERFTTPADLVRVTPLRIVLKDSPAGKATLGPLLNASRSQREQLFDQIAIAAPCLAGAALVGDIGLSVASGTGFLEVEIGGAEATTGELVLESPFGEGTAPPSDGILPDVVVPGIPGVVSPPLVAPSRPVAEVGPLEERCESAHPLRDTGCSKGALLAVGLVGLGATAAVGALDWRHQRRRRARAAEVVGG
jgi:hypothetical protein